MEDLLQKKWLCRWDFDSYDAIIISGSPITLTDKNKKQYLGIFPFIENSSTPILWICFWHQLLGHHFGSNYRIWDMIDGKVKIDTVNRWELLFKNIRRKVFHENHEEEITLPKDFRLLAYSSSCSNEAMKHKTRDIYWVQFHPELSGKSGEILISNFLEIVLH